MPTAIITGAGSGIGRATCVALAGRGWGIVAVGRREAMLRETLRECGSGGVVVAADVSTTEGRRRVAEAAAGLGKVGALVNNAGAAPLALIEAVTPAMWEEIVGTNLTAPLFLTQALWPQLKGGGVVVNVSSQAARDPFAGLTAYGAAKAGLNLLTLGLAREGAGVGVRVHGVAPGAVETAMLRGLFPTSQLPAEQTLAPGDVAAVIVDVIAGSLAYTSGETIYLRK